MKKKLLIGIIAGVVVISAAIVGVVLATQNNNKGCPHNNSIDLNEVPATCQSTGLSQGSQCADCGEFLTPQTVRDKIPCNAGSWIVDKQVSYSEDGREHTECTMCGKLMNEITYEAGYKKLEYTLLDDGTYKVTGLGGCGYKDIIIPSEYNGKPVTVIGCEAFYSSSTINSIVIPDSVIVIEDRAFKRTSGLTSITIGNSVQSIGEEAFLECWRLESIVLPDSLESIGVSAFNGCSSLTSINIPEGVTSIPETAFKQCSSLTNVTLPGSLVSIGREAFAKCISLETITIPNSVLTIEDYAFSQCSKLTTVNVGSSLNGFGDGAFRSCYELTTINYNGTRAMWNRVGKGMFWIEDTNYTVNCLD